MILATHAVIGAAAASLFPERPIFGFTAGFLSHFLLDAIPHWDYPIRSGFLNPKIASPFKIDKELFLDILTIGSDILLGSILALLIFSEVPLVIVLLGVFAGIFSDALQVPFSRTKFRPFVAVQNFHKRIQAGKHVHNPAWGIAWQAFIVIAALLLTKKL